MGAQTKKPFAGRRPSVGGRMHSGGKGGSKSLKGGRKPQESVEELKGKWLHHRLKVLRKALKKAKVFETRKIQRRILQAKEAAVKQAGAAPMSASTRPSSSATDLQKLQAQLEAAKFADLDQLARLAAEKCGMVPLGQGPPAAARATNAAGTAAAGQAEVIQERLLRSGAVRKELLELVTDFNTKFKAALKAPAKEADNAEGDAEGEAEGSDGDSEGPSDSPDSVVEEEEEARGPVEDGEAAGAGSLHLLSKLMAMRQTGRDRAPTQAKVAQGEDSDDSGVINYDSDRLSGGSDDDEAPHRPAARCSGEATSEEGMDAPEASDDNAGSIDSQQWDRPAAGGRQGSKVDETSDDASSAEGDAVGLSGLEASDREPQLLLKNSRNGVKAAAAGGKPPGKAPGKPASDVGVKVAKAQPAAGKKTAKYDPRKDDPLLGGGKKQKNRMGQHARQKLAEAKFGREAKHIQMMKEQEGNGNKSKPAQPGEDSGPLHPSWAAKRKQSGAIAPVLEPTAGTKKIKFDEDGGALRPAPKVQAPPPTATARGRPPPAGALKPRPGVASPVKARAEKASSGPLHPSWEAHKKQRAAVSAASSVPAAPTGKKTVFED